MKREREMVRLRSSLEVRRVCGVRGFRRECDEMLEMLEEGV